MGIKSNKQQGRIYVTPLSVQGEIIVLSGSPAQTYDKQLREYNPDHTLVPLVMIPRISAFDGSGSVNGEMTLTGVEWFEGAPQDKSANRIVDNEYYTISDGSGDVPRYALTVRKMFLQRRRWNISPLRYSLIRAQTEKYGQNAA